MPPPTFPRAHRFDWLIAAMLVVAAGAFFRVTLAATLELSDEGMIIYPGWLVARGALPYGDFRHMYGPSLFFLNGALLDRFGVDLLVVRWPLLLGKALLCAMVYLLSRRVASRVAASLVTMLLVAIWGTPVWLFNVPYANLYALPLSMAGVLVLGVLPHRPRLRLALAGLAIGLAATFKQTLGIFFALAVASWILAGWHEDPSARSPRAKAPGRRGRTLISLSVPLGSVGVYLAYAGANIWSWNTLCLLAPAVAGGLATAAAGMMHAQALALRRDLRAILVFGTACALPLFGYAAFFASRGLLGAFVFHTVSGLPQQVDWFESLPLPPWRSVGLGAAMVSSLLAARAWGRTRGGRSTRSVVTAWSLLVLASIAVLAAMPLRIGLGAYFGGEWTRDMAYVVWWLPVLAVYGSFVSVFVGRSGHGRGAAPLRLFWLFAAGAVVQLYPAADLPHAVMILPACLPLLAHFIDRARNMDPSAAAPRGRLAPTVLLAVMVLGVVVPCGRMVSAYLENRPATFRGLARAGGVWAIGNRFTDAVALCDRLPSLGLSPDGGLFVLANEQLLYVLAGVSSPFPRDEFVFYLVEAALISPAEARALVDEGQIIDRLETMRPLIVDHAVSPAGGRFRAAFPQVAQYLAQHYRELERVGDYVLWRWTASASGAGFPGAAAWRSGAVARGEVN